MNFTCSRIIKITNRYSWGGKGKLFRATHLSTGRWTVAFTSIGVSFK